MFDKIPYKSFCWSFGTTSFRRKNFNKSIEEQLMLLNKFWAIEKNMDKKWEENKELQAEYYDFIKDKGFVSGNASNKAKDAREKVSGLVDIGLLNESRRLSPAGLELLRLSEASDFSSDNLLQIPKDSFIYLKQLLKVCNNVNGHNVRPFIVLIYALSELNHLSKEEFTYLLPLCFDDNSTNKIISGIKGIRSGKISVDEIIIDRIMEMDNYQAALKLLLDNSVSEDLICTVGVNRKSRSYDKVYYVLYKELYELYVKKNEAKIKNVFEATKAISIGILWRKFLFNTFSKDKISKEPKIHLNRTVFDAVSTEEEFKCTFFEIMHLFKAKATLSDYYDLNKRYIKTTDVILIEDSTVKLDIIPKQFFNSIIKDLYKNAFIVSNLIYDNCSMEEIDKCLVIDEAVIIKGVSCELGIKVTSIEEVRGVAKELRYKRLEQLIEAQFTNDKLLELLELVEKREDKEINNRVTENADIPTIFEYLLGILWYKISGKQGDILKYMKLSLDADLLPKTHAGGGEADIVYEYDECEEYPAHTLLLEATLSEKANQRRMEMEPVSRHLGQHLLNNPNDYSYCVFATNNLDINVTSDFRNRKNSMYYDSKDHSKCISGMKIIPLETSELKTIITNGKTYRDLYGIFDNAHRQDILPDKWYKECLKKYL